MSKFEKHREKVYRKCALTKNHINRKQLFLYYGFFFGRSVIPLIDINGDGRVSVEELAARTDKSMKAFYKDEANTRLKSLDTNNDGKVSWDEYTESAEKKGGNLFVEMFCDFTG